MNKDYIPKSKLDNGRCPNCKGELTRIEWYENCEVVVKSVKMADLEYWGPLDGLTEIHYGDDDPTVEYDCKNCQCRFVVDRERFYESR